MRPFSELQAEVKAEHGELVVVLEPRGLDRVRFHPAQVIGETRNRRAEHAPVVVGLAVDEQEGGAQPSAIAELELVLRAARRGARCALRLVRFVRPAQRLLDHAPQFFLAPPVAMVHHSSVAAPGALAG